MDLIYFVLFVGCLPFAICKEETTCACYIGYVVSGVIIFFMLIIIIVLSLALYMVKNNKSIFGVSISSRNPTYVRQESGIGVTLCNVTSSNNNEQYKNDGSTLTVNSGVVEINGLIGPETPTRIEEFRTPCIKKPIGPIIPTIQKAQMDKIIEGVLNRKQKSDSATFRELDALTKPKHLKPNDSEFVTRRNSASLNELDRLANAEVDESLYGNALTINFINKYNTEIKPKGDGEKQNIKIPKIEIIKDSGHVNDFNTKLITEDDDDEHEVYDTVPSPIKCKNSDAESDDEVDNIHVYDMPPRRSWEASENRNVIKDHDTQYLLPLSKQNTDEGQDKSCYVNAKHNYL